LFSVGISISLGHVGLALPLGDGSIFACLVIFSCLRLASDYDRQLFEIKDHCATEQYSHPLFCGRLHILFPCAHHACRHPVNDALHKSALNMMNDFILSSTSDSKVLLHGESDNDIVPLNG
jgi:hypothetical protein